MLGRKRVLREHEFVDGLGRVIEQQFFPNLKRLKAQAAGVEFHADAIDPTNSYDHTETVRQSDETTATAAYTAPRGGLGQPWKCSVEAIQAGWARTSIVR